MCRWCLYTGVTNDYERRLNEHNQGINKNCYTYLRRPVEMLYCEAFADFTLAISWEKRIKDWSRKKKEALIERNWSKLKEFSSCNNESSHRNTSRLRSKWQCFSTPLEVTMLFDSDRSDKPPRFMRLCRELTNRLNYESSDFRKNQFRLE